MALNFCSADVTLQCVITLRCLDHKFGQSIHLSSRCAQQRFPVKLIAVFFYFVLM